METITAPTPRTPSFTTGARPATTTLQPRSGMVLHVAWVFALGIMAGFFGTYSANINLATATLDGPTYALIQSSFNRNVRHFLFFVFFFGVLPLSLGVLVQSWSQRHCLWWRITAASGLTYLLGIVVFTRQVNLPLNYLTESWPSGAVPANWAEVRDAWNQANLWRAGLSACLFAMGLWTLVERLATPANAATDKERSPQ